MTVRLHPDAWMSRPGFVRINGDRINGLFHLLINGWPSKNRCTSKWMVEIMENPIKMDDLGIFPLYLETPKYKWNILGLL